MLVHAPMHFQPEEIVSSVELGFHEFEQSFEVVCALSFSPLSSLPNQSDQVSAYFEMFSKVSLDDNKYKDCGSLEIFFSALAKLFLCRSHDSFQLIDDGGLVIIPEKQSAKSYVLDFLHGWHISE
jgi:hypothetical protein